MYPASKRRIFFLGQPAKIITPVKLVWQKEYFAVSVSESIVERVRQYITNQESHHKKVTWDDEYAEFVKKYGFNMY